ncbi:MAG: hypothetical protein PHQ46_11355 [Negativicutes bacterium]|nr:hypothetical protein [Negativicutes bacterium]
MKAINDSSRKANVSKFLRGSDLLVEPQKLFFITIITRKRENEERGTKWTENVFLCMDMEGEDKVITEISNSALWREIDEIDPEVGQLFEFSAEDVGGNYPIIHAKLIKGKIMEGAEADYDRLMDEWGQKEDSEDGESYEDNEGNSEASKAGRRVLEDKKNKEREEDEITIDDIPF